MGASAELCRRVKFVRGKATGMSPDLAEATRGSFSLLFKLFITALHLQVTLYLQVTLVLGAAGDPCLDSSCFAIHALQVSPLCQVGTLSMFSWNSACAVAVCNVIKGWDEMTDASRRGNMNPRNIQIDIPRPCGIISDEFGLSLTRRGGCTAFGSVPEQSD